MHSPTCGEGAKFETQQRNIHIAFKYYAISIVINMSIVYYDNAVITYYSQKRSAKSNINYIKHENRTTQSHILFVMGNEELEKKKGGKKRVWPVRSKIVWEKV